MGTALLIFSAGVAYEMFNVLWVHHSARGHRLRVAALASAMAGVELLGVAGAVREGWWCAAAFVGGYGAGSFFGVVLKERLIGAHQSNGE